MTEKVGKKRTTTQQLKFLFRQMTYQQRVLPNFIVIGVEKGGTTSLYEYLGAHPNVAAPIRKEPHFFSYYRGMYSFVWYKALFPLAAQINTLSRKLGQPAQVFEASSSYIDVPETARLLHAKHPNVKLIALLRNPVSRAYSQYAHQQRLGIETLSFEDAIDQEAERISGEEERMRTDLTYYGYPYRKYAYLRRGIYADHLQQWFEHFPKDQLLILRSEDLFRDAATTYAQTLDFLRLPRQALPQFTPYNAGKYPPMKPETRDRLKDYFRPHNQRLYAMLGRDFGWDG